MSLPTWCAKAELEAQYRELKRVRRSHSGTDAQAIDQAYEVLADSEKRSLYDESLGLAAKRKSRIDLRPLGFFSKSLSSAQQSWPTCERELLAVLACLLHFRTIVAGMPVVIHTDHLNNTILGEKLGSPDKILRMLLKIDGLVQPRWVFAPGVTQIGDGISRNPPDRDAARISAEEKDHMPKTLSEAFALVTGSDLAGKKMNDDTEAYTAQFVNRSMLHDDICDAHLQVDEPIVMTWLLRGAEGRVVCRANRDVHTLPAILLPDHINHDGAIEQYENLKL